MNSQTHLYRLFKNFTEMSEIKDEVKLERIQNMFNPLDMWMKVMNGNLVTRETPFAIYAKSWEMFFSSNPDGVKKFVSEWGKTWSQFGLNFPNPFGEFSQNQTLSNPFLSFNDFDNFYQNSMFGASGEIFKIYFQMLQEFIKQWNQFWKL